ncbi:MAG: hypothetical protein IPQ09_08860 [Myxococcales bacterium]|nr:hypothetical protein [Myxococcales bacterium]HQY61632.1 hypothetical protein [Polyangiaceae bacterium]
MKRPLLLACGLASLMYATPAGADLDPSATYAIETLRSEGLEKTEPETISELLPRPLPSSFTGAELVELRRRIKNLALFDQVEVDHTGTTLLVRVRRKFTLSPIFDLSTGKTLADSKLTLGAIQHDVDGHGTRLGGKASYSERGLNFILWLHEHPYRPRSWAREQEIYYAGSGFRFEGADAQHTWQRNRLGAEVEFLSPSFYTTKWRYEFQLNAYQETLTGASGPSQPRDGTYLGTTSELVYDRYTWNDLTPRGFRAALELRPGIFVGPAEPRHELRAKAIAGLPLGNKTVLMLNASASAVNGGNPNHSALLGSQAGVRGLPDSLYRNRSQAYANLEVRHAIEIARRWYVQGVLFTDAAVFEPMDARGASTPAMTAWSTGAGLRLLPTALVDTLLRVDVARIHHPIATWFAQFGITQHF